VERDLEDTRPLIRPGPLSYVDTWAISVSQDATKIILRTDSGVYAKAAGDGEASGCKPHHELRMADGFLLSMLEKKKVPTNCSTEDFDCTSEAGGRRRLHVLSCIFVLWVN